MSDDRILRAFLETQYEQGTALARASDLFDLTPVPRPPYQQYLAAFHCHGLVKAADGQIEVASHFEVGIWFPDDYLRRVDPCQVLFWLGPRNVWHPNISDKAPVICLGRLAPATPLVDLVYQVFEIITYRNYNTADPLNRDAAAWARRNQHRLPVDRRPLKRRTLHLHLSPAS